MLKIRVSACGSFISHSSFLCGGGEKKGRIEWRGGGFFSVYSGQKAKAEKESKKRGIERKRLGANDFSAGGAVKKDKKIKVRDEKSIA